MSSSSRDCRVVHVIVAGDIGGAERLLVDLASRPEESRATHSVALMTPNPKLREYLDRGGLRVVDRGRVRENAAAYLWRSFGPSDVAWLADVFAREGATVAHMHTFASHVIGVRAAKRARIATMRTEHHVMHYDDVSCSAFTRWALARTDSVVAISDYVRDYVVRAEPRHAAKFRVVRNGVDATHFAYEPPKEVPGPFTFAVVCRLEPWKDVGLVLDALALVPGANLVVAGDGSEKTRLQERARASGIDERVKFLGYVNDPRPVFASADAAVSSSRDEPLGLSVLETLATGRPVVAFAGGGIPEIVRDGDTGWLVGTRSASALAATMREAMEDRARVHAMGISARRFVDEYCRIEAMCEGYARAYEDTVAR